MRRLLLIYDMCILVALLAGAVCYALLPSVTQIINGSPSWFRLIAFGVWFGVLGSISISLKGIGDHGDPQNWTGKWPLWYVARPASGIVVGVMTYALLRMANTSAPSLPALAVAAFIFGTQEARFFGFLAAVGKLILSVPGEDTGVSISGVAPNSGVQGTPIVVIGGGFATAAVLTVGDVPVQNQALTSDGTAITGLVPPGHGMVSVDVTNPDGTSARAKQRFTYTT